MEVVFNSNRWGPPQASTSFENSRSWVGLQLADVLAGSVARSLTARKRGETDPYINLIFETALSLRAFASKPGGPGDWPRTTANNEPPADALEFIGGLYAKTRRG